MLSEGEFATSILEDYAKCKKDGNFGIGGSVLCDAEGNLKPGTKQQLNKLLDDLQSKVTCNCDNGCSRGNELTSDFVGLLIVSDSNKTKAALRPLSESAQYIYEDALLGNETCDNGLLIVYLEDQQKLATYRGGGNFLLLTDNDVNKLHKASNSNQQFSESDQAALRYLLTHYDTIVEGHEINRSDSFTPYFGLLIALILIFLILTCLIACCLARICSCSSSKQHNQIIPPSPMIMGTPDMPSSASHNPIRPTRSSPIAGATGNGGGDSPRSDISIDLPFMDPNRPREIQTKKDYLY
uniref:TPM domain-containing protein n=1 Tax=Panagrolaimus sp. ES5 TaxID=591445 RepID=A0AC34FSB0_9BILA